MKLEYGTETLGNDALGDFILDHGGTNQRTFQRDNLPGSGAPFSEPKGNHTNDRSFTVSKQHTDGKAAIEWFNAHPDGLPDSGTLRISESNYACEMAQAILVSVERFELSGKSTLMKYNFTGGQIANAI